eukprot:g509.t1
MIQNGNLDAKSLRKIKCKGLSPLLFALSTCDEGLSLDILGIAAGDDAVVNETMEYGTTPLHLAVERRMMKVVKCLIRSGVNVNAATTVDVRLQFSVVQSGGTTPLHLAAEKGDADIASALCAAGAQRSSRNFDDLTPFGIALLQSNTSIDESMVDALCSQEEDHLRTLAPDALASWIEKTRKRVRSARASRSKAAFEPLSTLRDPHTIKSVWSSAECAKVLTSVIAHTENCGWTTQRHRGHASTTDIQCCEIVTVDAWVRSSLKSRLWPALARRHGLLVDSFTFQDLFFVKYSAATKASQRGVGVHRDGCVVSFNILLNSADDFEGGGTFIEASRRTYSISKGDCFVHSGKIRHGGAEITKGERYILVGFLDARLAGERREGARVEIHVGSGDRKDFVCE